MHLMLPILLPSNLLVFSPLFLIGHTVLPFHPAAATLTALGLVVSLLLWSRVAKRQPQSIIIAIGGLAGALVGAKIGFWLGEAPIAWGEPDFWGRMVGGKTILGSLLFGWIGVEWTKRVLQWHRPTGDDFARIIPIGIALGRVGCVLHGCCQGRSLNLLGHAVLRLDRWPAAWVEIGFQIVFLAVSFSLRNRPHLKGQHFHLYMISYGLFRFFHEFLRDTPRYSGTMISPYMLLALACAIAGTIGFVRRARGKVSSWPSENRGSC